MFGGDDKRAYQLEQILQMMFPDPKGKIGLTADPMRSLPLQELDLSRPPFFRFGRVIDSISHFNSYRVLLDKMGSICICVPAMQSAFGQIGGKCVTTYPTGTKVIVMQMPNEPFGIILAAVPDLTVHPTEYANEIIHQGSRVGWGIDEAQMAPLRLGENCNAQNWSSGRFLDGLSNGEHGVVFETGLKLFMDSFFATLSMSEETGLWVNVLDELTRLGGHNLQVRSFGYEREHLNDESELHFVERYAAYPWEALGVFAKEVAPYKTLSNDTVSTNPEYSKYEPLFDDQQAFHRLEKFRGYLAGGGEKRVLKLPPQDGSTVQRYSVDKLLPGVFEETLLPTGQWGVRSAKAIFLAKDLRIPVQKQRKRPEDPTGDSEGDYRASGVYASGPVAPISTELTPPVSGNWTTAAKACALTDTLAFAFNWENFSTISYHTKDWFVPEESQFGAAMADAPVLFAGLAVAQFLSPSSVELKVDDRYGNVTYYRNGSSVVLHDDGTVTITAAYGEQLILSGGSGFLSMPGDFWLQTGKNFNVYAGKDICLKANKSFDASANRGDMRFLAGKNLHALSGNTGEGGTLIENRAQCRYYDYQGVYGEDVKSSGITLKSSGAPVAVLSIETIISNQSPEITNPGNILIDAGDAKIVTHSFGFDRHIQDSANDLFESGGVNEYKSGSTQLQGDIKIEGSLIIHNDIQTGGWVYAREHFASGRASEFCGVVRALGVTGLDSVDANLVYIEDRQTYLQAYHDDGAEPDLTYPDGLTDSIFSMRTPEQYGTVGQVILETKWQQQSRLSGQTSEVWSEVDVLTRDRTTLAHPGYEVWKASESHLCIEPVLYDSSLGIRVDRGAGNYELGSYNAPVGIVPDSNYRIITNPS